MTADFTLDARFSHCESVGADAEPGSAELNAMSLAESPPGRLTALPEPIKAVPRRDVRFTIDPDSHDTSHLVRMDYGVSAAQKAWIIADRVVDAWPFEEFERWMNARRGVSVSRG